MTGYSKKTLAKAKGLRRDLTEAERKLWSILRNSPIRCAKFRRQQPIGPFIADFVCHEHRLIIEADGGQHCDSEADDRRTVYLRSRGYSVLRFWNHDILGNIEGVAAKVGSALSTPHPARALRESPSPSRGEGISGAPHA